MAQVYNRLTLDVKKKNHDIITAVQHDAASRYLDINLIDNGVNINLTGHEVRLYARKPDQQEIFNNGQITNAEQGRVQIELTSQMLAKEGYVEAQVITYKNNQQILSTLPFKIHVVSNLMSDNSIESSNEYGALVILYQNLYEAYDLMTTMIQNIGTPGANAQELNLNTMFEVWDWLIDYLKRNSSAGIIEKVNAIKAKTELLTNGSYGLNAISEKTDVIKTAVEEIRDYSKVFADITEFEPLIIDQNRKVGNSSVSNLKILDITSDCLISSLGFNFDSQGDWIDKSTAHYRVKINGNTFIEVKAPYRNEDIQKWKGFHIATNTNPGSTFFTVMSPVPVRVKSISVEIVYVRGIHEYYSYALSVRGFKKKQ